jgi:hypothetical protein
MDEQEERREEKKRSPRALVIVSTVDGFEE